MWTVEKITELCKDYCGRCNVTFNSPVIINKRLTRTLGRCYYTQRGNVFNPSKIEISYNLLETATDASIEAVIAHECAHYVSCAITHENHGHDETFRYFCQKIGTANSTSVYDNIELTKSNEEIFKYTIYCEKCGGFLGGRSRSCKIVQSPWLYTSKCCGTDITVKQNW